MLTDANLRSKIDALWDKLWSGGLSNPLDAIEQLSFLLFLKRLDEREQDNERAAKRGRKAEAIFPADADGQKLRWSHWTQLPAGDALKQIKERVFPFLKTMGGAGGSFAAQMENAEFKINKPSLLIEACKAIDEMQISAQNQDVQGDLYEYLLSKLNTAGTNGQFRTPRHIIRLMVKMLNPQPGERVCDPAAGTCGFPVNAWQHILETHTDPRDLTYDDEGYPHGVTGAKLTQDQWKFCQEKGFTAFDSDSGMTMLRIGSMNLMLHGINTPNFRYTDTLSKAYSEERAYDCILANPPFKGAIDAADVNPTLPVKCKKTEKQEARRSQSAATESRRRARRSRTRRGGTRRTASPHCAAANGDQPAHAPVLGGQGSGEGQQIRPLRQPLPAGGTGRGILRNAQSDAGTAGQTGSRGRRRSGGAKRTARQIVKTPIVKLTEILCELESGGRPKGGAVDTADGILSLGGEHVSADGSLLLETKKFVPKDYFESMRRGRLRQDDILIVKDGATTGKVGFVDSRLPLPAAVNEHVFRLSVNPDKAHSRYVFYHLLSPVGNTQILHDFRGATVGGISQEFPEFVELPLPELSEQRRIAERLEQADGLRRTRRYALELSATFLPAAFLQLFGEDANGFPVLTVEELLADKPNAIRTGPFGSQLLHSEFTDSGIAVLGIDNAVNNHFAWDERRFISPQKYEQLKRYTVFPGDVIITLMGTCGRCAVVPDDIPTAINTKHLCCITLDQSRCLPFFLHGAFLYHPFVRHQLSIKTKGSIMEGLNMGIIQELRIPLPPLTLQQQFAGLVARVERLRAVQRESLRQAEHLFQSLLHRAFTTSN